MSGRRPRRGLLGPAVCLALLLAALAVVAYGLSGPDEPTPAPAPGVPRILWSADTETGDLSQWTADEGGGVYNTGSGVVEVDDEVAHGGGHSLRFSITGADGTTGNQATRIFRWATADGSPLPDEAYYSAWYRFPQVWRPREFWNIFQWKTTISPDRSDPTFILDVFNGPDGAMRLAAYDWIAGVTRGESPDPLPVGRWVHIEARLRWSEAEDGALTVWQDGRQVIDVAGVRTAHASTEPFARGWSLDNYTNGVEPPVAAFNDDDAVISLDRVGPTPEPEPVPTEATPTVTAPTEPVPTETTPTVTAPTEPVPTGTAPVSP